ncbi:hypothetical protein PPERSA_07095 [Pseudocohnilembus persalinus]|uniref:Uncharacterized protein n=1 Tax=Pseudocohnilembus persalinus TaxID=266149 RepID=A0A0V0QXL2_PSEPJ|nr:hypothetical protein PPERSA_07095 [Pseudocohnilembus persalinus]|eukprot:KRX06932.1 hypothetical protein PPERSA_07095 [Pseudocohnilembus persalinus]
MTDYMHQQLNNNKVQKYLEVKNTFFKKIENILEQNMELQVDMEGQNMDKSFQYNNIYEEQQQVEKDLKSQQILKIKDLFAENKNLQKSQLFMHFPFIGQYVICIQAKLQFNEVELEYCQEEVEINVK